MFVLHCSSKLIILLSFSYSKDWDIWLRIKKALISPTGNVNTFPAIRGRTRRISTVCSAGVLSICWGPGAGETLWSVLMAARTVPAASTPTGERTMGRLSTDMAKLWRLCPASKKLLQILSLRDMIRKNWIQKSVRCRASLGGTDNRETGERPVRSRHCM